MAQKYTKGNTRVLLDLGPLYSRLTSYALEVGISLSAVIRIILNDAIIRGTVTLPPLDGSRSSDNLPLTGEEDAQGRMD